MVERKASIDQLKMGARHAEETRKRCLPLEIRVRLYDEVLQLRREEGLSYNRIIERIHRASGIRLTKTHIRNWVRGKHEPLGKVNNFDGKPSPELASIIGTLLSDGSRYQHNDTKAFWLGVKDKEYAEGFGRDLAKVLRRRKPYKPHLSSQRWVVEGHSILLFNHLNKPWDELKPFIEHRSDCVAAFLRAFFDGEGSIRGRQLTVSNTDRELLIYIKELLKRYFDIDSTGPHLGQKSGTVRYWSNRKKAYKTRKDCYSIYIRTRTLPKFYDEVGFTIRRKQQRLAEAAKQ